MRGRSRRRWGEEEEEEEEAAVAWVWGGSEVPKSRGWGHGDGAGHRRGPKRCRCCHRAVLRTELKERGLRKGWVIFKKKIPKKNKLKK